jgi:hypothetical protein
MSKTTKVKGNNHIKRGKNETVFRFLTDNNISSIKIGRIETVFITIRPNIYIAPEE